MIEVSNGLYHPVPVGTRPAEGGTKVPAQATFARQAPPPELMLMDPGRVTSISDLANRSVSYRMAVQNLDDFSAYLSDLV